MNFSEFLKKFKILLIIFILILIITIIIIVKLSSNKTDDNNKEEINFKSSMVSQGVREDDLGNIVNGQYFFDDGTNQYYSNFDTSGNPHIYMTNKRNNETKTIFDGFGWSFAVNDGWLYFSGNSGTSIDATYTLFRIKTDGSNLEHINNAYSVNMNFYKEWLYYTRKTDYYSTVSSVYRSSLDGSNEEEIINGVNANAISLVFDEKLYYLDQNNDIYSSNIDGSNKIKISNDKVDYFVIGQGRIIYLDKEDNIKSSEIDGSDIKIIRTANGVDIQKINSFKDTIVYVTYSTFNQERYAYPYSIYTVKTDGTNDKKVYDGISWGFYINLLNDKIYVLDYAKDTTLQKQIAITKDMDVDGTNLKTLSR